MKNCNMSPCNMPRYDISRNMSGERNCYMQNKESYYDCGEYPIGMGYVPWQEFRDLYDLERGFQVGTIYKELDKPFTGRRSFRR